MAYPKKLNAANKANQDRAVLAHTRFVQFVDFKVGEIGLENVLKCGLNDELYWLKEQLNRVLDFAEQVQLKMIPQQIEGDITQTVIMAEIKKEDSPLRFDIGAHITQNPGYPDQTPSSNN